jgi:predicted phage terminase large subunit-like protein
VADAVESCVNGPSGLRAHNPSIRLTTTAGGTHVRWPNGVEARLFGAFGPEDVERLRAGGNRCCVWAEELAAWPRLAEAWDHMELGLRLGPRPHVVASTTPKPRRKLTELMALEGTVITRARTSDNPHLHADVRARLYERYQGTRLGRQELLGEILTDVPGALWSRDLIEACRVRNVAGVDLVRVVVGVDPSGGHTDAHDAQGIVVVGLGDDGHGYVLEDASCRLSPDGWGRRVVRAYDEFGADRVVVEANFGGEMARHVVETAAAAMGTWVPVELVTASRGKMVRAEPVSALYEQGRMHHVGSLPDLEDELTGWVPGAGDRSPDRLDALVWAATALVIERQGAVHIWAL